jgi:hypothetical protein
MTWQHSELRALGSGALLRAGQHLDSFVHRNSQKLPQMHAQGEISHGTHRQRQSFVKQ